MFKKLTNFTFGGSSAIITNISLIVGMGSAISKPAIIGSLLIIAIADNISDSLGIHIYRESEYSGIQEPLMAAAGNFVARFIVSLSFIGIMLAFSINKAEIISAVWGLFLLAAISYLISRRNNNKPFPEVAKHIVVAVIVISASKYAGYLISRGF